MPTGERPIREGVARGNRAVRTWSALCRWGKTNLSFGRDMQLLVFSMVIANFGSRVHERFFSLYVRDLGASIADLGWVMTVNAIVTAMLGPIGGWASDRYRRSSLLALGPAIGAVGALARAGAPTWTWLIPGMVLGAMPALLVGPASFGLISDLAPPERRGAFFGYQGMMLALCGIIGPLLGGIAYQSVGYRAILMADAALLLTAAFMRYRINDPREARRRAERHHGPSPLVAARQVVLLARSNPQIGILFTLFVVSGFASMLTWSFASVYIREELHLSLATLGMVTGLSTLAMMPANLLGGLAADRLGRRLVLVIGLIASTCQFLLLVYARSAWHLAGLFSLGAAAQALLGPASQALMADIVPSDQRGTFLSVMNSGGFLLTLPAPVLGAFLWDHVGPTAPFWAGGALLMAATVVTIFLLKEPRARPSERISAA